VAAVSGGLEKLSSFLAWHNFGVLMAEGVDDGIAAAKEWQPALVVVELLTTVANGPSFLAHIKSDDRTAHIPVIVVSSETHPDAISDVRRKGAAAIIVEPYEPGDVLTEMRRVLSARETVPVAELNRPRAH
jgi:DNA-binding response OmpR family regulator